MTMDWARQPSRREFLGGVALASQGLLDEACAVGGGAAYPPLVRQTLPGGLEVRGPRLYRDGRPFFVAGMNHWAAPTLARDRVGWDRVRHDFDVLQGLGVNAIRLMGSTEGPDSEPFRIVPSMQPSEGQFDEAGVAGLFRVVEELEKRRMVGIVVLTNFWQWSGGMAQYVAWAGGGPIPYPTPDRGGDWGRFQDFAARFYETAAAREAFGALVRRLVPPLHRHASVVWELANEPRGVTRVPAYRRWIDETARLIKSLAPGQLVTTGSEGETAWPALAGLDVVEDHRSAAIDFATCHLWAQNWGWVSTETLAADFGPALDRALSYVTRHAELAAKLGKPIVLEEFGFPRDGGAFDAAAPTALRDRYFEAIYSAVHTLASTTPMAGIMPWAWAGACQPPRPGELWRPGDPLSGDPPHEPQGWYGIGEGDSTLRVIREGSARLAALPGA